jgi:hypothetical protein
LAEKEGLKFALCTVSEIPRPLGKLTNAVTITSKAAYPSKSKPRSRVSNERAAARRYFERNLDETFSS